MYVAYGRACAFVCMCGVFDKGCFTHSTFSRLLESITRSAHGIEEEKWRQHTRYCNTVDDIWNHLAFLYY